MSVKNAVKMAQQLLIDHFSLARCIVDATAGNGQDTLFLAAHSLPEARVWAFDLQQCAVDRTKELLALQGLDYKVRCIVDSHENVAAYVSDRIDIAMFNLGYLPGGCHQMTTRAASTIAAVNKLLPRMNVGGIITIVAYPGHSPGAEENKELSQFLALLPQAEFTAGCWSMVNQKNNPPVLYIIEKRKEGNA